MQQRLPSQHRKRAHHHHHHELQLPTMSAAATNKRSRSLKMYVVVLCRYRCALKLARPQDLGPMVTQPLVAARWWTKTTMAVAAAAAETTILQRANLCCRQRASSTAVARLYNVHCARTRPTMPPPCASTCPCTRANGHFAVQCATSASPARSTFGCTCVSTTRSGTTTSSVPVVTAAPHRPTL